ESCLADGRPSTETPPLAGVCEPIRIDFGELRLETAVAEEACDGNKLSAESRARLARDAEKWLKPAEALVRLVGPDASPGKAEWLITLAAPESQVVYLRQRATSPGVTFKGLERVGRVAEFGPFRPESVERELPEALVRIARARNLLSLTQGLLEE